MGNSKHPSLILIAGPNGSGKTSVIERLRRRAWLGRYVYINSDEIAQHDFGDWNSPNAIIKGAKEAIKLREACFRNYDNFILETVLSSKGSISLIRRAIDSGYFIRLFYVGTDDPAINVSRVAYRVQQGGHNVPEDLIIRRYERSIVNLTKALTLVSRGYVWDNSVEDQPSRPIFRTRDGVVVKLYQGDVPGWCSDAIKALKASSSQPQNKPEP